jgi:hypothetical protein
MGIKLLFPWTNLHNFFLSADEGEAVALKGEAEADAEVGSFSEMIEEYIPHAVVLATCLAFSLAMTMHTVYKTRAAVKEWKINGLKKIKDK